MNSPLLAEWDELKSTLQQAAGNVLPFGSASHAAGIGILAFRIGATQSRSIKLCYDFIWSITSLDNDVKKSLTAWLYPFLDVDVHPMA